MDETRDPNLSSAFFAEKTRDFFAPMDVPNPANAQQAEEFINAIDVTVDALTNHLRETGLTFSDTTILYFGSPLGEALRILFNGAWRFSEKQERWVVECLAKNGGRVEMNVFRKIEKRIENGMEDSISFYLEGIKKIMTAEPG